MLLAFSNTLPVSANQSPCNPGILGLCTDKDPVAQICKDTSAEKKVLKCLPPNTVQLIITPNGMSVINAQGKRFVIDSKYIGQFIRSGEKGENFILLGGKKVRVTYYSK